MDAGSRFFNSAQWVSKRQKKTDLDKPSVSDIIWMSTSFFQAIRIDLIKYSLMEESPLLLVRTLDDFNI